MTILATSLRGACTVVLTSLTSIVTLPTHAQQRSAGEVYMRNMLPDQVDLGDGDFESRVVGGTVASPGAWPAMVVIFYRGKQHCGGTIIDREWVLTAAHCVVQREARDFYVRENANVVSGGRRVNVASIMVHERFTHAMTAADNRVPLNDVALMRLAAPAQSQRQALLGDSHRSAYLEDKKLSTVIGYGLVTVQAVTGPNTGTSSEKLLQVDLPIASQPRCSAVHGTATITDATVCAGFDEGGKDSCKGDSGGPLFVRSPQAEAVQVGIVSWGPGCGQPRAYGVYASVGYFESWIRQHVPNASFTTKAAPPPQGQPGTVATTDQTIQTYVGPLTTLPPSQLAQVSVDILSGRKIKIGERMTIRVTSSVPGSLFVFNQEFDGKTVRLFPNRFFGTNLPGQARATIAAGKPMTLPGPTDRFAIRIAPPAGMNRVIAMVVPPNVSVADLLQKDDGLQPIANFDAWLQTMIEREQKTRGAFVEEVAPRKRAVGIREYEIVP